MAGTKKAKGWQAKEQQRKQKTEKINSKKQQKKRGDIGKEESEVQIKPCEEEGKKGLEEYTNDLTEENHSQDSASSSTTQQSTPSLQKKKRVSPREGRPPLEDKANVMDLQRIAEKFSMEFDLYSKISIQETKKTSLLQILPPADDEDVGAKSKERNAKSKEEKAKWEEENAILKERVAKCEEGSEQGYESIKEKEVLLRQGLSNFHETPTGNALNKALMTWGRKNYPKELGNMPQKFSLAIAVCVDEKCNVEDAKNKLKLLKKLAKSWKPKDKGVLKDLVWNQKCGECYFVTCKTVAILNAKKFHPNIKGVEATRRIEKMASNGEFIFEGVDVGEFMVTQLNRNKV